MPFHHLYNLIKRSQIKIKAVGTPCRNLLHIIRAGNQAFPRLTIIFRTLPRNKPVLLRIMIPEKNSSFIQSYPNIGFGSICFTLNLVPVTLTSTPCKSTLKGRFSSLATLKYPSPQSSTVRLNNPNCLGYLKRESEFKCTILPSCKITRICSP